MNGSIPWQDTVMNSIKKREYRRQKRHDKQEWKKQAYREILLEEKEGSREQKENVMSKT